MFLAKKEPPQQTPDSYAQLKQLVHQLLQFQLPNHSPYHHLLLTANNKLQSLQEALHEHRKYQTATTAVGRFHQLLYEQTRQQLSQLQIITEAYMQLADDTQQEQFNHRLLFHKESVEISFRALQQLDEFHLTAEQKEHFYSALQSDCLPILYALFD